MHTCFSRKIRRFTVFLTQSGCDSAAGVLPCKIDRRLLKTRQTRAFSSAGVAVRCERGRCEAPPLSPACLSTLSKSLRRCAIIGWNVRQNRLKFGSYSFDGYHLALAWKSRPRASCGLTVPPQERKGRRERRKRTTWFLRHLRHLRHRQKKKSSAAAVRCCGGSRRPRPVPPARTASGSSSA